MRTIRAFANDLKTGSARANRALTVWRVSQRDDGRPPRHVVHFVRPGPVADPRAEMMAALSARAGERSPYHVAAVSGSDSTR
jgi:hypothetical protein